MRYVEINPIQSPAMYGGIKKWGSMKYGVCMDVLNPENYARYFTGFCFK